MIKLSLPGFYSKFKFVKIFLNYYFSYPDFFYKDRVIDSFYDADQNLIWRGGRNPIIDELPGDILPFFNELQQPIKLRHVFTNCLLDENMVNDYTCNHFVQNFIRENDEVILNHPLLIEHFKKNYPHIPIIYSTTLDIKDIDKVNEISKNNIYVMNYNFNNNPEYIKQLQHKENIEILCAEPCNPNCPQRMKHYHAISKAVLYDNEEIDQFECPFGAEERSFFELMTLPHAITNTTLLQMEQEGFQYFKISGRSLLVPQWLYTILYYLTLPQYLPLVYQDLLCKMW